ncbi:hypothetical protein Q4485_01395 [Granulosicoccaceae sp. 1_MG-2023]|nr:hypothetical protein [Granulosicoccaceae sp. 1_MG-2023]
MSIRSLPAVVVRGHRIASGQASDNPYPAGSLEMQTPFFLAGGLDLSVYHRATINLSIKPIRFAIAQADFVFRDVRWAENFPAEDFLFAGCRVGYQGQIHEGMIYYPDPATKIGHFQDPSTVEVLTQFLPGLTYGSELTLILDTRKISLSE